MDNQISTTALELDDIQSGVLRPRPSPFAATYVGLRIDEAGYGRELLKKIAEVVTPASNPKGPLADTSVSVALTCSGFRVLRVPPAAIESMSWEFRQGMASRAKELGDLGESAPENWEAPFTTGDIHVIIIAVAPTQERLEAA